MAEYREREDPGHECLRIQTETSDEVIALKAVCDGEADAYQQRLAISLIVNKFSRTHDLTWIPREPDQTSFLNGRAFVGSQILQVAKIPIGKLLPPKKED